MEQSSVCWVIDTAFIVNRLDTSINEGRYLVNFAPDEILYDVFYMPIQWASVMLLAGHSIYLTHNDYADQHISIILQPVCLKFHKYNVKSFKKCFNTLWHH